MFSVVGRPFLEFIAQGAATQCFFAAHPDGAAESGAHFADCNVVKPNRLARDDALADEL